MVRDGLPMISDISQQFVTL